MTIATAFVILQLLSAGYDLWMFCIPNILPIALVLLFLSTAVPNTVGVDWASQLGAGTLVFVVGAVLFRFRLMGGGDVKLFAATALWTGLPTLLPLVALTALFGGLLVLILKFLAPCALAVLSRLPFIDPRSVPQSLAASREIPYGIAIAGSALVLLHRLPPALLSF
jgi:prepilin peptidase CpaA